MDTFGLFSRRERAKGKESRKVRAKGPDTMTAPQAEAGFLLRDAAEVKATFTPSRTQLAKTKSKMKSRRKKKPQT